VSGEGNYRVRQTAEGEWAVEVKLGQVAAGVWVPTGAWERIWVYPTEREARRSVGMDREACRER
jgi:hypothetical protein